MTQKKIQPIPVVRASSRDYEVAALVGDDAVILGWTMDDSLDRSDLLGFAIRRRRRDQKTSEELDCQWLPSDRRFAMHGQRSDDDAATSQEATTRSDPIQQFHFLDYAIERGNAYSYSVQAVRGTPALRYYEPPVTVSVHLHARWPDSGETEASTTFAESEPAMSPSIMPCPLAEQRIESVSRDGLAGLVSQMCDSARSAVFLYSTVALQPSVLDVVREVNSGRLLYGLVPGQDAELVDVRRAHNTVHLSQPAPGQVLRPVTIRSAAEPGIQRYTSALVTDPWSRSPGVLLWSDSPGTTPRRIIDSRLIARDKRGAARLAVDIFHAYAAGRLPQPGPSLRNSGRRLEPDGRWSNIYFSRHAASHKFREREIFSGHP